MKKNLVAALSLIVLLASCSSYSSAVGIDGKRVIEVSNLEDPEGLEGLEYLLAYSTNFVRAKLVSVELFDLSTSTYELRYEVAENYAGYAVGEITVYEDFVEGRDIIGGEAHLMLFGYDNLYYPHAIYTSIDKDFYVQKGTPAKIGGREYSLEQLIEEAQKAEASGDFGKRCRDYNAAPSGNMSLQSISPLSGSLGLEEAYREADVVLEVVLGSEHQVNKYVSDYTIVEASTVKSTQAYAGGYAGGDIIALPPGLEQNVPYWILLKENTGGGFGPFSREFYAVPAKSLESIDQMDEDPTDQIVK
ncbi:MAG: hypothetical protein FWG10_12835 [Eubacteriaceae bacterium]|nr:hypothetical protein [Eubacteriaceae bacterium]